MDFGRNNNIPLKSIDFQLPPDHPLTLDTLKNMGDTANFDLRIGTSVWGRKEWKGSFYPEKALDKDMLNEYASRVNYIELNSTFYQTPSREQIQTWYEKTEGQDFLFSPKMTKEVTHVMRFCDTSLKIAEFVDSVKQFNEKLGPVYFQCSDNFGTNNYDTLIRALSEVQASVEPPQIFIELRHPDWFSDLTLFSSLTHKLSALGIGLVLADTATRRDVLHMALTVPKAFIRFNGNGNHSVDEQRYRDWADRIVQWRLKGLSAVYFTIHQSDMATFPASLQLVRSIFAEKGLC